MVIAATLQASNWWVSKSLSIAPRRPHSRVGGGK